MVDIRKLPDGRTVWLETGNSRAGLQHIVDGHAQDFAAQEQVETPALFMKRLSTASHRESQLGSARKGLS
ncbi:hypothetical protein CQ054_10625 [Ochrobactrum sp. MYb29]|nr:hypothetical protein CQ054_10625 [Ochrobactrum sp. MYb29]